MSEWSTIESEPAIFGEIIRKMGVKQVQVKEVWDINSDDLLMELNPSYGLIFLFQWTESTGELYKNRTIEANSDSDLFYAKQIIKDACATQALLSVLLNAPVDLGEQLKDFKEFTKEFPPDLKGEAIGDNAHIRDAHNAFARPEPFFHDPALKSLRVPASKEDEVYHFITLVPFKGFIYELDGLQSGPIKIGSIEDENNW